MRLTHSHELHAVVQRRLPAKQKQEVFFLWQHHGGQLEEEELHLVILLLYDTLDLLGWLIYTNT